MFPRRSDVEGGGIDWAEYRGKERVRGHVCSCAYMFGRSRVCRQGKARHMVIDGPLATENEHWRASFLSVGLGLVSCNTM